MHGTTSRPQHGGATPLPQPCKTFPATNLQGQFVHVAFVKFVSVTVFVFVF